MIRYYICHFFYRYLARFFPLYIRLDPKWNQIIGYISKDKLKLDTEGCITGQSTV